MYITLNVLKVHSYTKYIPHSVKLRLTKFLKVGKKFRNFIVDFKQIFVGMFIIVSMALVPSLSLQSK